MGANDITDLIDVTDVAGVLGRAVDGQVLLTSGP
jgi:hypothetical protein